ncbi:MAG: endonuclease/exonuclease/phosphatase family protein [Phycisphaerales bacterium]
MGELLRWARTTMWLLAFGLVVTISAAWVWPGMSARGGLALEGAHFVAFAIRTLSFQIGLGVLGLVGVALALRQWRLSVFVLAPVALFALGPESWWIARTIGDGATRGRAGVVVPAASAGQSKPERPDLIVLSHNTFRGNGEIAPLAEAVKRHDADVVLLQEASRSTARRIHELLIDSHPHFAHLDQGPLYGQCVMSRFPLVDEPESVRFVAPDHDPGTHPFRDASDLQLRVRLDVHGRRVLIQNIHLISPMGPTNTAAQGLQVRGLVDAIAEDRLADASAVPVLLMGDFNSTPRSRMHAQIRSAGLRDVHASVGVLRGDTWPAHTRLVPESLGFRIDHAFVNGGLKPRNSRVLEAFGSDHRAIVVGLDFADSDSIAVAPTDASIRP